MISKQSISVLCVLSFLGASSCLASARDHAAGLTAMPGVGLPGVGVNAGNHELLGWKIAPVRSDIQISRQQSPQETAKSKATKRAIRYYR